MPRFGTDEQFKFLISCIRFSDNGRIDFGEVAKECSIVTKGAAAKRYERMMKAHSIGVDMKAMDGSGGETSNAGKKRKRAHVDSDDESGGGKVEKCADSICQKKIDRLANGTVMDDSLDEDTHDDAYDIEPKDKISGTADVVEADSIDAVKGEDQ